MFTPLKILKSILSGSLGKKRNYSLDDFFDDEAKKKNLKGKILKIGWIDQNGLPEGWEFDCSNGARRIELSEDQKRLIKFGGYTMQELRQIANCKWVSELCKGIEKAVERESNGKI